MEYDKKISKILVALPLNTDGRKLLNWAIAKLAGVGDHVVAVHVCRKSDVHNRSIELDGYIRDFEALSSLKQVTLMGRIAEGTSIKKQLLKEANLFTATAIVVGVKKRLSPFWMPTALVAKYCKKKLPLTMDLFAVHDGNKLVFKTQSPTSTKSASGLDSEIKSRIQRDYGSTTRLHRIDDINHQRRNKNHKNSGHARSLSLSFSMENFRQDSKKGWPLLQRTSSTSSSSTYSSKASVVEWTMRLPDRSRHSLLQKELAKIFMKNDFSCRWFKHKELKAATNGFSSENLIGKGGSGRVYMGILPDGFKIAVKITKLTEKIFKEFLVEADIITTLQHHFIVPLVGVSINSNQLITVYKCLSKGSLDKYLHGESLVSWESRFKVALRISEALCYLHDECPLAVIHRDIKPSNILLSDNLEPLLSDFGLAIWAQATDDSFSITCSNVAGTFGYLAPEYLMHGKVSEKMDVYSFGVVVLELLTGRRPISSENLAKKNRESLVMWARKKLEKNVTEMEILDPNIESIGCNEDQIRRMMLAANLCTQRVSQLRPKMSQVVGLLRGDEDIESWMKKTLEDQVEEEDATDHDECYNYSPSSVASHLSLALQDVDGVNSFSSADHNHQNIIEEYLQGRCSSSLSYH